MEYTVRQFRIKIKEALDLASKGEEIIIFRHKDCFKLKADGSIDKIENPGYRHQEVKVSLNVPNEYGCGCVRIEGKVLCSKHGRV